MRRAWTADEIETVRINYPGWPTYLVAYLVGRSERAVYQLAMNNGWKKSAAYLTGPHSGRKRKGCKSNAGTFRKGHPTWNRGVQGSTGLHPNCRKTQFRKGRPASDARNYQPIGSLRLNKDGQLVRKVTDDPTIFPARRWVGVHRLVWEAANGPIPAGHAVAFRPGQHTTDESKITPSVLELVTRAELMRRNSYHNRYPKDVARLIQLRGALNRKINKRAES